LDNDRPVLDLMKMSPAESARVRRELEAAAAESGDANRRQSDRKAYPPRASAIVHILQAEWGSASFRIWPRNISGSGIGFLHGGFVYPGTRVMVELPRSGRDPVRLSGRP